MSDHVQWVVRVAINSGKLNDFKAVMADMIASTEKETGALAYEWHINADESECVIYERYATSQAVAEHFGNFGAFAERFGAACSPQHMLVLGNPTKVARDFLDAAGPEYLGLSAGFSKA